MKNCTDFYRTMCFCLTHVRNTDQPITDTPFTNSKIEKSESNFEQKFAPSASALNNSAYEKRFLTTESNRSQVSVIRKNMPYSSAS